MTIPNYFWATIVAALTLSACSNKPPGCADPDTLALAKNVVAENTVKALGDRVSDDPDSLVKKFLDAMKVEITGIVSEGYKEDAKKQLCRGTMKITMLTGDTAERTIVYSTQKTVDQKGGFLLEIEDFAPFIASTDSVAWKYFTDNRWAGTWSGTYSCNGIDGATTGPQGPFSMPVSMVVQGTRAKLERTTQGGGVEVLEGGFDTLGMSAPFTLSGAGENTPDDKWGTSFTGKIEAKKLAADGTISIPGGVLRQCHLDLTLGGALPAQAAVAPGKAAIAKTGFTGSYRGEDEGTITAEISTPKPDGSYAVSLSTNGQSAGGGGCSGSVEGIAKRSGDTLNLVAEEEGSRCEAKLKFDGAKLVVDEGEGCSLFHGAACAFSGTLDRIK